jgi:hypothetical protein
MNAQAKLCYVDGLWAWFTTKQPFTDQWGGDWNDAPYECNAGDPYGPKPDDETQWELFKVAWDGPYETPTYPNSNLSVESINNGASAWLIYDRYSDQSSPCILGGTTYARFKEMVTGAGGVVYVPVEVKSQPSVGRAAKNEPAPAKGKKPILPLVLADLESRADMGKLKYGTMLESDNGRDSLMDAYQEACDLVMYLRQAIEERNSHGEGK